MNAKQKQARLAILKDALALMKNPNIAVKQNFGYAKIRVKSISIDEDVPLSEWEERHTKLNRWLDENANNAFHTDVLKDSKITECSVCAKGAMFMAKIDRHNQISVNAVIQANSDKIVEYLSPEFSKDELDAIEGVFEANHYLDSATRLRKACRYKYGRERLISMLKFLIRNGSRVE